MSAKRRKKPSSRHKRPAKQYDAGKHPAPVGRTRSAIPESRHKQKNSKTMPQRRMTCWRLWLFRIIAVTVIPALLFLLLELSLRIGGYGFPTSATRLCPAYNNLAEILNRQGKIDEAVQICRRGLRFSPNSAILHGNLGILLNKLGRRDESLKELNIALELDPNSTNIRKVRQTILRDRTN